MRLAVVILAAGQGTRMRSVMPKVLHEAAGRTLLEHVLRAVAPLKPAQLAVVIGHGAEQVRARFPEPGFSFVYQERQLGTGHALMQTRPLLEGQADAVMVLNGDGPLVTTESLRSLLAHHQQAGAGMTLLTAEVSDPSGLGRIVRGPDGHVRAIVEEKDASEAERRIREINPGFFVFGGDVFRLADKLSNDNASGEYYITDLVDLYLAEGQTVGGVIMDDPVEVLAVNDRAQLATIDRILRDRVRAHWLGVGVTMISPELIFIDDTVTLEPDVVLHPGVVLKGKTHVKEGVVLGPYVVLEDCTVEMGAQLEPFSYRQGETLHS